MKLSGSYQIKLEKQKVWEALNNPEILKKAIPGCEEFIKKTDTEFTGKKISVIICDTFGRAWRKGQTNVAIGSSGIEPLESYIGEKDTFDNELFATEIAIVDELAGAAELVMKKSDNIPIVIIKGVKYNISDLGVDELIRNPEEDFFL